MHASLTDFDSYRVTIAGKTKDVLRAGTTGPCIIICHELPAITPEVAEFARYVVSKGFRVSLPVFVGKPGIAQTKSSLLPAVAKVCISREFNFFSAGKSSPIVDWLRAFGRQEHARCGGPGIGVVGMCFSGGFALGMAVDPHVLAPVVSQPGLPGLLPGSKPGSIDVSEAELAAVRARLDADQDLCVLGFRFSGDKLVPAERFAHLQARLGNQFVGVTFDSGPGNPDGYPANAHSVLSQHLVPAARDQVIALFERQLLHR
jgi:dienelactone hydrolase